MRPDPIELDETPPPAAPELHLTALDRDAILNAVHGGSVVDWTGLSFRTIEEVDGFLALWHCDVARHAWARERLVYLYNQAVNYLEEHVGLSFAPEVRRPPDVRQAFLRASMRERFSRQRIQYCAILKLVHVINHLEMQELRGQSAVREVDVINLANDAVLRRARRMRALGFPIREFHGNRKTRPSVITKLLAKRESTAATIYDKLRYRLVTETRADIVPCLAWLMRHLIPFPSIIPAESHNNLLSDDEVRDAIRQEPLTAAAFGPPTAAANVHTASTYRTINFIADIPVRIYDIPALAAPRHRALLGEAVHVMVEFQVVDAETDKANESGDNRHDRYKQRQMQRVLQRLGRTPRRDA